MVVVPMVVASTSRSDWLVVIVLLFQPLCLFVVIVIVVVVVVVVIVLIIMSIRCRCFVLLWVVGHDVASEGLVLTTC